MQTTSCPCCADQVSMNSSGHIEFSVLVHVFAVIAGLFVAGGIQALFHPSHVALLVLMFFLGTVFTLILSAIVWGVKK